MERGSMITVGDNALERKTIVQVVQDPLKEIGIANAREQVRLELGKMGIEGFLAPAMKTFEEWASAPRPEKVEGHWKWMPFEKHVKNWGELAQALAGHTLAEPNRHREEQL